MLRFRAQVVLALLALLSGVLLALLGVSHDAAPRASANPHGSFVALSAGDQVTCGRMTDATIKCWGAGTVVPTSVGISAPALRHATGGLNTCVVEVGNSVECWAPPLAPSTPLGLGSGVASISPSVLHLCLVTVAGGAKCMGDNGFGQLGDGTVIGSSTPVDVSGLSSGVAQVDAAVGNHTCALTVAGAVKCWGQDSAGELGSPGAESCSIFACSTTPVDVPGLSAGVAAIDLGSQYSCALLTVGAVKCWGLGFGTTPTTVVGLESGVVQIAAGWNHFCARMASGGIKCRGQNAFGQLGDGTTILRLTPVDVVELGGSATDVAVGDHHTCAVLSSGEAKCWGHNVAGALGLGESNSSGNPVPRSVVTASPKPTPTATPCGPGGCPTATPTLTPPPATGLEFSVAVDTNGDNSIDCGTAPAQVSTCSIAPGAQFKVQMYLNSLPVGVPGYRAYDTYFEFQGVTSKPIVTHAWPDCSFVNGPVYFPDFVATACAGGAGAPASTYIGLILEVTFTCTASGSVALVHDVGKTTLLQSPFQTFHEGIGTQDLLTINCTASPAPTSTPTPASVGGVALMPAGNGDASSVMPIVIGATALVTVLAGLWYRRSRRV